MAYQVMTGRFVGRADELARLRELLAHTAGGEPLVALVSGEAGVGKTRLADQVAGTAADQGMLVLRGGCVPLGEEGVPFAPVTEALRGWPAPSTRTSWRRSPVPPVPNLPAWFPTLPGATGRPWARRWRAPVRGGCSSSCWAWSSGWAREGRWC